MKYLHEYRAPVEAWTKVRSKPKAWDCKKQPALIQITLAVCPSIRRNLCKLISPLCSHAVWVVRVFLVSSDCNTVIFSGPKTAWFFFSVPPYCIRSYWIIGSSSFNLLSLHARSHSNQYTMEHPVEKKVISWFMRSNSSCSVPQYSFYSD